MKKYMDIERLKEFKNDKNWNPTDIVVVQEKMDGSNASFQYDEASGELKAFSRRQELSSTNTLNGFYNWVKLQEKNEKLFNFCKKNSDLVFFGEWGVKNKVKYKEDYYGQFYFYDIYTTKDGKYMYQDTVKIVAKELGLNYVNTLYEGEFKNWDNMRLFMGKSNLAIAEGEGVVVKNQTLLNSPRDEFYLKLVCESFSEVQKIREPKAADPNEAPARAIVDSIVTERRIEKMLCNLRDDGIITEPYDASQMRVIAQNLPKRIWEDINKEEPEAVEEGLKLCDNFGKFCSSKAMELARKVVLNG